MFCKYCGKQVDDDARFCAACGKALIEETPVEPVYYAPAQPVYEAPAETDYQPQYAAPAQPVYEAPAAPAPESAPASGKTEMLPLIAAFVLATFSFIGMIVGMANGYFLGILGNMFAMGAAALAALTLFGILKNDNLFYAIALFALAFVEILYIDGGSWWASVMLIPAYVLAGLYYILKGKLFGNPIKMIMAIAVWAIGSIVFIVSCVHRFPAWNIISSLFTFAAGGLMIFGYTPYKK